jgi:hypothetical protein
MDDGDVVEAVAHLGPAGHAPGELGGAAVGDDAAADEDEDAVGELLRLVQVVGGEQDGGPVAVGEPVHQVVEVLAGLRVEACAGLVEEQQLWAPDQADRHVQSPSLTAGERGDPGPRLLSQPDQLQQLVGGNWPTALRRVEGR